MKNNYRWFEAFDGGIGSEKLYTSKDEAIKEAKKHIKELRWTANELKTEKENGDNFVFVEKVSFLENGEIDWDVCDIIAKIEINEKTVSRVY